MKALHVIVVAIALVAFRLALHTLGADAHASVVSGMPLSAASIIVGPVVMVASLATSILAPVLAVAAVALALHERFNERGNKPR